MAATLLVAACSSQEPSETPAGWQLVAQKPNGIFPTLQVSPVSDTAVSVVLAVAGGCPDGGPASPTFTGFTVKGETIEAVVSRTPIPSQCIVTLGTEFDVLLDLRNVPTSVRRMVLGGLACVPGDDFCAAVSAPLPVNGLATPSP